MLVPQYTAIIHKTVVKSIQQVFIFFFLVCFSENLAVVFVVLRQQLRSHITLLNTEEPQFYKTADFEIADV